MSPLRHGKNSEIEHVEGSTHDRMVEWYEAAKVETTGKQLWAPSAPMGQETSTIQRGRVPVSRTFIERSMLTNSFTQTKDQFVIHKHT